MKSRVLLATLFTLVLCLPALPAQAAPVTVTIQDMAYSKTVLKVRVGTKVVWKNHDSYQHTTTSDQGFWSSPTLSNGNRYDLIMASAGTYPYHCEIHSDMHATVKVVLKAKGSATRGWKLIWASTDIAPVGRDYDVQYKRKGTKGWDSFRKDALKPSGRFNPHKDGKYLVRARTSNTNNDKSSGWSPTLRVKIS